MAPDAYEEFTDRQRTRVVRRESDDQAATEASIGSTQSFSKHKERLFDGLSIAQIIAGAAAAATSVMLASRIGIAGSVIGAAVSSVVTVVSSQLYRRFLTASAEKLKKNVVAPAIGDDRYSARGKRAASSYHAGSQDVTQPMAPDPIDISSGQAATWASYGSAGGYAQGAGGVPGTRGTQDGAAASAGSGTRIAPKRLQARAEAERAATQRKVVAFSIASAVMALVACTAVILVLTAGEGLGARTAPILAPATEQQDIPADTTAATSENDASSQEESHAATDSESNPGTASDGTPADSPSAPSASDPATGSSGDGTQGSGSGAAPGDGTDDSESGGGTSGGSGDSQSGTSDGTGDGVSGGATGQTPAAGATTGGGAS